VNGRSESEWAAVADRFGVDMEQVRRDHLISHVLAAISVGVPSADVVFFGGTALSRTYLTAARLSEDLDLIAVAPRSQVAAGLEAAIRAGLARSHGAVTWRPALTATRGSNPPSWSSTIRPVCSCNWSRARATPGRPRSTTSSSATPMPHPLG